MSAATPPSRVHGSTYESADVQMTVRSQTTGLPVCNGIRVMPSKRLPFIINVIRTAQDPASTNAYLKKNHHIKKIIYKRPPYTSFVLRKISLESLNSSQLLYG